MLFDQLLAHGQWFSPASSTAKSGRHDIAEILLNVALKHKKSIKYIWHHLILFEEKRNCKHYFILIIRLNTSTLLCLSLKIDKKKLTVACINFCARKFEFVKGVVRVILLICVQYYNPHKKKSKCRFQNMNHIKM